MIDNPALSDGKYLQLPETKPTSLQEHTHETLRRLLRNSQLFQVHFLYEREAEH